MIRIHEMKLHPEPFEKINNEIKTVEIRLFDEKRKALRVGHLIEFSKKPDLQKKVLTKIVELQKFKTFEELQKNFHLKELGFTETTTKQDFLNKLYEYYTPEEENIFGVLAIRLKKVD